MKHDSLPLIEFRNVSKTFWVHPTSFLRSFIVGKKNKPVKISAAQDVDFSVKRGQIIGLYGPNGSGKSTILRLGAGILQPDTGKVILRGSLASVIELGSGLHHELTGEENIKLYATILGIPFRRIEQIRTNILEFSGVRDFINIPLKYYSTGMRARLATAIAIFADTDIILLDEAITVGDSDFREKFLRTIKKIKKDKAIIFTTHDFGLLQHLSDKVFLVNHGNIQNNESEMALWYAKNLSIGKTFEGLIQSNSMYPLLKRGSKFKVLKNRFSDVKKNDVIAFTLPNIPLVVVHRVAEVHKKGANSYCITKGDASVGFDVWRVTRKYYLGKLLFKPSRPRSRS